MFKCIECYVYVYLSFHYLFIFGICSHCVNDYQSCCSIFYVSCWIVFVLLRRMTRHPLCLFIRLLSHTSINNYSGVVWCGGLEELTIIYVIGDFWPHKNTQIEKERVRESKGFPVFKCVFCVAWMGIRWLFEYMPYVTHVTAYSIEKTYSSHRPF